MKHLIRLGTALLVLSTVLAVLAPAMATAQEQTADPPAGPAGMTFTFHLNGFDNDERVGYWLNTPIGTILAIDNRSTHATNGLLTYSWTTRPGVPLGTWQFVAQGVDSGVQKVAPFQVAAAPGNPSAGPNSAEPTVGSAAATFAFSAYGFANGERVGYWLNAPTGSIIPIDDRAHYADSDGEFNVNWLAPAGAAPGGWQLVAQGSQSGVLQIISFEIR
jgi:hypothetical protein